MKIRIVSELDGLAYEVAAHLGRQGYSDVDVEVARSHSYSVRHTAAIAPAAVSELLGHLNPLRPPAQRFEELSGADVELRLGDDRPLRTWNARVYADSTAAGRGVKAALAPLGLDLDETVNYGYQARSVLSYGGATAFARHAVRWMAERETGVVLGEVKEWGDDDHDLWIRVCDPAHEGKPARSCFPLVVETDDPVAAAPLLAKLVEARFQVAPAVPIAHGPLEMKRFRLDIGPLESASHDADGSRLRLMVDDFLGELGVDRGRYPLESKSIERDPLEMRVRLPLGAYAGGRLRPYAGPHPERFPVLIRTEDPAKVAALVGALREIGFPQVEIAPLSDATAGFDLRWGALGHETLLAEQLKDAVEREMLARSLPEGFGLSVRTAEDEDDPRVQIDFPTTGIEDGSRLVRILERASGFEAVIYSETGEAPAALVSALEGLGFRTLAQRPESGISEGRIKYGGAPVPLIGRIEELVAEHTGVAVTSRKEWADYDDDIWLYLPAALGEVVAPTQEELDVDLGPWLAPGPERLAASPEALLAVSEATVRVGDVVLPRRPPSDQALVPEASRFVHYCVDQATAETLQHLAASVLLREPCLLEGPTSTSKTSSVLYLASLLRQPVVRLNLNGQTDTGELVGRFLPSGAGEGEGPGERSNPWRWHDGLIVSALKSGWWIILDEVNLAEPQILERLNSILEREPMLVLTEHDNGVIGPGGTPVHRDFRIFATMNPAEYAGRSALSPAYRDRWLGYRFVARPSEADYEAMLRFIVYGEEGSVVLDGQSYRGRQRPSACPGLAEVAGIDGFVAALARFHAGIEHATFGSGGTRLGSRRKEPYVFTRRGLLGIMRYLESTVAIGVEAPERAMRRALMRYYLGRVASPSDRAVVIRLLDAAGLGPNTWTLAASAPELELEDVDEDTSP